MKERHGDLDPVSVNPRVVEASSIGSLSYFLVADAISVAAQPLLDER